MNKTVRKKSAEDTLTSKKIKRIPVNRIREKAFENYLKRGRIPGNEVEDWLRAEKELKASTR